MQLPISVSRNQITKHRERDAWCNVDRSHMFHSAQDVDRQLSSSAAQTVLRDFTLEHRHRFFILDFEKRQSTLPLSIFKIHFTDEQGSIPPNLKTIQISTNKINKIKKNNSMSQARLVGEYICETIG